MSLLTVQALGYTLEKGGPRKKKETPNAQHGKQYKAFSFSCIPHITDSRSKYS